MIWREHRVLLGVLGALLIANGLFFFTYRVQYEARLGALNSSMSKAESRLQSARAKRLAAQQQLQGYARVRNDLQTLYTKRWATQAERFTAMVEEVKRLAAKAQLEQPRVYSFSRSVDNDVARTGIGIAAVSVNFSVKGTYQQLRQLINFLELSNQFIIIDGITLEGGGATGSALTLNLHLKTLFREPPPARPATPGKAL